MSRSLKTANILVFDSGAGGLSVAAEILKTRQPANILYLADNAYFPYGTMEDQSLIARVGNVIAEAIVQFAPDIIVVACNTASTLALAKLRAQFPHTEFVGVVPAIKPAAAITTSKTIGVLATPATVNRFYTKKLIDDFARHCNVLTLGSSKLVFMAEEVVTGVQPDVHVLTQEVERLVRQAHPHIMDTVVLACTHFPLLNDHLKAISAFRHIRWIDSGEAIASRVAYLLQKRFPLGTPPGRHLTVLTTKDNDTVTRDAYCSYLRQVTDLPLVAEHLAMS